VGGLPLGWLDPRQGEDVGLILLTFVFPLQLLASVFGYLGRDIVAGTGMGLLAGTWLSIALVTLMAPRPGATSDALGLFLLLAGAAMLVPFATASLAKLAAAAVRTLAAGPCSPSAVAALGRSTTVSRRSSVKPAFAGSYERPTAPPSSATAAQATTTSPSAAAKPVIDASPPISGGPVKEPR